MTDPNYRTYSKEFKQQALELLKTSGKSASQIERELGITSGLLLKWRDRSQVAAMRGQVVSLEPSDLESAKAEIRRLRRELAETKEEREILKQALKIFFRKNA